MEHLREDAYKDHARPEKPDAPKRVLRHFSKCEIYNNVAVDGPSFKMPVGGFRSTANLLMPALLVIPAVAYVYVFNKVVLKK